TSAPVVVTPDALTGAAELLDGAAARLEERQLAAELSALAGRLQDESRSATASPLWSELHAALELADVDRWARAIEETSRLVGVRERVLRADGIRERIADGGAPRWAREIAESRGAHDVVGDVDSAPTAWELAKARTWLASLHTETDVDELMEKSHADGERLHRAIVDLASRSARVELKKNNKDRQRRALENWLTAVKRIGKGTGKNAPRFQAAA